VSDLSSELTGLNAYAQAAGPLPPLTAVDETVTKPSAEAVRTYLSGLGRLRYPVAFDTSGRVADGYGAQDQPWFVLISASGKILWSHDGWLPCPPWRPPSAAGYRPSGKVICSGATSGVPTSSWICACAFSGMSRGLPVYTWPLSMATTCPEAGPT